MWFDTLSMARLLLGNHLSVSLDNLARHWGLAAKSVPYNLFKNKHWDELQPSVQQQVADGCIHDVNLTWEIFKILGKDFPREEYEVIDETIKMFTNPVLQGDVNLLAEVWEKEETKKSNRLQTLGVDEAQLQSSEQFANLLRAEGVESEMKDGKNGSIYAFAKTDQFMRDLLEDDNERVRGLAEARLGVKSTLMQTRAETLGFMARRGPMPVYLRCYGAHTTRWSGGDGANWQNFKRNSDIRRAILAPEGYLLGVVDLSQIECRLLNYLAGQDDVTEKFRNNEDPYVGIASRFYGRPISKDDANERGTGKQAELSCGYGCGKIKFQATAKLGIYGPPVHLDLGEADRFVRLYRDTHWHVVNYWEAAEKVIQRLYAGHSFDWGPLHIKDKRIYLPNGAPLIYDTLEWRFPDHEEIIKNGDSRGYWRYKTRNGWDKLYGAKLVEQTTQALARIIFSQGAIRCKHLGYRMVTTSHDEGVFLIPDNSAAATHLERCRQEMKREPVWLPGIPLDAEASLGKRYSK